jgi:DNA-binding NtrC family response regulator
MLKSQDNTNSSGSLPVIIIEDDATTLEMLRAILLSNGLHPVPFATGQGALEYIRNHEQIGALLIDLSLPDMDGMELLREAKKLRNCVPGFILTASNDAMSAVTAMKAGATDYFTKPFDALTLVATLQAALALRPMQGGHYKETVNFDDRWKAPRMRGALSDARQAALSNTPVVICGPISTGKDALARFIHRSSANPRKRFHEIDLAETPEECVETALFGCEPSPSGSRNTASRGFLVKPRGETLYLKNLEKLGRRAQARLLEWMSRSVSAAAGGAGPRLVCSTTVDMEELMGLGMFRRDLWFRLAVTLIRVPSLSQRSEDIPILCQDMLTSICVKGKLRRPQVTRTTVETLMDYPWPYNLMELQNVLSHAVANTSDGVITPVNLPRFISPGAEPAGTIKIGDLSLSSIDEITKASLRAALDACNGNRRRAAQRLKVSLRTIYYMIKRYDMA